MAFINIITSTPCLSGIQFPYFPPQAELAECGTLEVKIFMKAKSYGKKPKYICKQKKPTHCSNTSCKNNSWYWGNILTLDGTAVLFTKMYFDTDVNPIFGHFKRSIPLPSLMLSISNFNTFIFGWFGWYRLIKIEAALEPPIKK